MRRDLLCAAALTGIAAALFLSALGVPPYVLPFLGDNLDGLNIALRGDPNFFTGGANNFVYRPVTYSSLWVEREIFGLHPSVFFTTNVVIWLGCALVMYGLVRQRVGGWAIPLLAGVALLIDHRVKTAMVAIIERQSLLACLFGSLALLLASRMPSSGRGRAATAVGVAGLLTASLMSKEYGAAFVAATATVGLVGRRELRKPLIGACVGAAAVYVSMRWLLPVLNGEERSGAGSGVSLSEGKTGYCEDMGFFSRVDSVCYGQLGLGDRLAQYAWNVGATLVGTVYPYFFGDRGQFALPNLARPVFVVFYPTLLLALAVTAWVKRTRDSLPFLVLLLASVAVSFVIFRHRNQLIGAMGLYGSAAIGIQPAVAAVAARLNAPLSRAAVAAAVVLLAVWGIGKEAQSLHSSLKLEKVDAASRACDYVTKDNNPKLVALLEAIPETARCRRAAARSTARPP